jgi:amidase
MTELWHLDAHDQAACRARGDVAPDELVRVAVDRAAAVDGVVNSIVHRRFEAALGEAADASGPLAGVPFAVKDWKCLQAGEPVGWATSALQGRIADRSSELAERYRRIGLVSIGRTNLPELAFGPPTTESAVHGPCRNPWNTDMSVGGSSGGSAAAVAAGIVPVANASDGGGSLRIPAAACGLVGLKVSRGRITNAPHSDGRGIKVEGHLTRSVRDLAAMLDLTAGNAIGDHLRCPAPPMPFVESLRQPMQRLRIGVMTAAPQCMNPTGAPPPAHVAAVEAVAVVLANAGHDVRIAHPSGLDAALRTPNLYSAERAVLRADIESHLGRPLTEHDVEPRTWAMFQLAATSSGVDVLRELDAEQRWSRSVLAWWQDTDVLLTPALGRDIAPIGELRETADDPLSSSVAGYPLAWFTYPFNVTGQPAITVPVQWVRPLPISVQFVADHGREDVLLQLADHFQTRNPPPADAPWLASEVRR